MNKSEDGPATEGSTPETGTQPATPAPEERKFTQSDIDRIIADRLKREKAQAEQEKLKEDQQWKSLAEKQEGRIRDLEAVEEKAAKHTEALKGYLSELRKGLPPHILELLDGLDVTDQLTWVTKNRELVSKASAGAGTGSRTGGNSPNPAPQVPDKSGNAEEMKSRLLMESARYTPI